MKTPGQAVHDRWCADDDWDELSHEERTEWEDAAFDGVKAFLEAVDARLAAHS
jgi:hypothetical protein